MSPKVPSLDRAATELGGDGFPESLNCDDDDPFGRPALLGGFGTPEVGGVARLLRFEKVGEKGASDF